MNRATRRAAMKAKPQTEKVLRIHPLLDRHFVFDDWERLLQKIEHGELEHVNGKPVMMMTGGEWGEVVPCMNGYVSAWKSICMKFDVEHDLSALVRLANCLHYGSPISQGLLDSSKAVIREQRRIFGQLNRQEIASAARTEQIKMMIN